MTLRYRYRFLSAEATLRRRVTCLYAQTCWRLIALNYPRVLRMFRDQHRMLHRERWAAR